MRLTVLANDQPLRFHNGTHGNIQPGCELAISPWASSKVCLGNSCRRRVHSGQNKLPAKSPILSQGIYTMGLHTRPSRRLSGCRGNNCDKRHPGDHGQEQSERWGPGWPPLGHRRINMVGSEPEGFPVGGDPNGWTYCA